MPLYEYECATCQKVHEVMQKFSDAPLSQCPECKGKVTKLMSMSSFALKGSGWYTTDYKRSSSSSSAKADTQAEAKTESKPEPKSGSGTTGAA